MIAAWLLLAASPAPPPPPPPPSVSAALPVPKAKAARPGRAPPPSPPTDPDAERFYSREAMAAARQQLRRDHGGGVFYKVALPLAEVESGKGVNGFRWNGEAWYGGDRHRLVIKSEGHGKFGKGVEEGEVDLLYARPLDAYWDVQAGIRQDFGADAKDTHAVVAVEGLAPYWFDIEAALFLSQRGAVTMRAEASYDQRITQRLILKPRLELNLSAQSDDRRDIGSGLVNAELGLRLRYEIVPEVAPYVGVQYDQRFGETRRRGHAVGDPAGSASIVIGVASFF